MSNAHRFRATWRNILFNGQYDDTGLVDEREHVGDRAGRGAWANSDFRLESFDLSRVSAEDFREMRQFLEGADPNEAYEGVMIATGRGKIVAATPTDLAEKTRALRAMFSIASCRIAAIATDPVGVLPFDYKDDATAGPLALRIYARPATGRPVVIGKMREGLVRPFMFQLAAFDPRQYAQALQSVAGATAGSVNLTNNGNTYTLPTITVVCTAGATIKVTIGGSSANSVTFTGVPAGTWTLDCRRSRMTKADGTTGLPYRTAGYLSSLFLMDGSNTFDTTGSTNLTSVTAAFRDAYA